MSLLSSRELNLSHKNDGPLLSPGLLLATVDPCRLQVPFGVSLMTSMRARVVSQEPGQRPLKPIRIR
jgi:hypothetical protein